MSSSKWTSKTAVVCGGSDGLGKELCKQLCVQSVEKLIIVARNEQRLADLRTQLEAEFPRVHIDTYAADMSQSSQVRALAVKIQSSHRVVDLVIQAVGKSDRGKLQDLEREHMLELLDANLFSSLNCINELNGIQRSPGGTFVLIGSLACHFAPRFLGGYALAKHALVALAQQSRLELAERGIHVMLASPGPIAREDAGQRYQQSAAADLPAEALKPGGGARIKGLDATKLANQILTAAAGGKLTCVYPAKAHWLRILSVLAPRMGERLLRNRSS